VAPRSADYALMFLSWHHAQDKPRAARELAKVLRPAGRLLLRANCSDHHPRPWRLEQCPRWLEVDASPSQPLHEVIAMFTSAGWRVASFGTVTEPSSGTLGDNLERLRLRTHSFFAHLSPNELEDGFRRLEQAVAAEPDAPAPVFLSRCSRSNALVVPTEPRLSSGCEARGRSRMVGASRLVAACLGLRQNRGPPGDGPLFSRLVASADGSPATCWRYQMAGCG
jgi:SAM-dependent methyltransferase